MKLSKVFQTIYKLFLESAKSLNPIFKVIEYWYKAQKFNWKMYNLVNKNKSNFLRKQGKPWNFSKNFSSYWSFLQIFSKSSFQKPQSNLLSNGILVQDLTMPNLVNDYKISFLDKWSKSWIFLKMFRPYWIFP